MRGKGKSVDFKQHVFFCSRLLFTAEAFKIILECSQITGNKMELKKELTMLGWMIVSTAQKKM